MEVIQLAANTPGANGNSGSSSLSAVKHRAQSRRQSQVSLLISSSSASAPILVSSSPLAFRYSCISTSSTVPSVSPSSVLSHSSSSASSSSATFFLNDNNDDEEVASRSNTSSPGDLPAYITTTTTAAEAGYRRSQYRSSLSRPLSYCSPIKSSVSSVFCNINAGVSGSKSRTTTTATASTRPVRSSTLPSFEPTPRPNSLAILNSSTNDNCLVSSSQRTDSGSRLSWYNPLLSDRFQYNYVDEYSEDFDDIDSCESSDTEGPGSDKSVFQAIQESILFFNTISDIPVPAFVEKGIHSPNTLAPPHLNSQALFAQSSTDHKAYSSFPATDSHVKKPSLVSLDTVPENFGPILEQDPDSLDDLDSLYNFSNPSESASTSITAASLFPSKEAAEAYARQQIDLEVEAAIKESTRLEEERRAREAEEDADFLKALHESIIAEKEAQARREDLEFLDRLFSRSRPVSPFSDCSDCTSISSRSSVYSVCSRNSTILTALSPPPPRSPTTSHSTANTSPEMPSTPEDFSTPLSYSSRERPLSAVRDKKPKAKGSAGDLYENSRDESPLRPTLHRAHTATSGGLRRLLRLSGRNSHADNSEDER
ncbi:hypothetical protein ABW20_dc0101334 [Dactylellina cionopaga]|nr:hypothetical protein ABW20_dc0101334 [Dactylellina cionopaga]